MTPKEKAKELIEKFSMKCDGNVGSSINTILASECALIVAQEMIEEVDRYREFGTWESRLKYREIFWQEVITELEAL